MGSVNSTPLLQAPVSLILELTSKCNLRCVYCFHFDSVTEYCKDLPTEEWLQFIEELQSLSVLEVSLSGGEPFSRPDFMTICRKVAESNIRYTILSNGTMITEDHARELADIGRGKVQVSLDQAFTGVTTVEVPEGISYETLADSYTQANMDVDATQLNNAIVSLYQKANDGADPSGKEIAAYIRLVAHINGTDLGWCCSNVITLPKVVVSYIAVMPADVYVAGPSIRGGGEPKELGAVYGNTGEWYGMVYMAAGSTLTYGDATSQASVPTTLDDQAEAGASLTDNGVTFANAGWYALYLKIAIENNSLRSALAVYPGIAAVTGNATNGFVGDAGYDATAWYLTAPADASGQWESPAFVGSGELRAYINIPGLDWWRTEFTICFKATRLKN